jgi:hypothetical protein
MMYFIKKAFDRGVVVHIYRPSSQEVEAGGLNSTPAWAT